MAAARSCTEPALAPIRLALARQWLSGSQGCGMQPLQRCFLHSSHSAGAQPSAAVVPMQHKAAGTNPAAPAQHPKTRFSLRPSFLSPLFQSWQQGVDEDQRRKLLVSLLVAQEELAQRLPGASAEQAITMAQQRVLAMKELGADLFSVMPIKNRLKTDSDYAPTHSPPACTDPSLMHGFYTLLDRKARRRDATSRGLNKVLTQTQGKHSDDGTLLRHFATHFAARYQGAPRLQRLEAIFAKPDPDALMQQLLTGQAKAGSEAASDARSETSGAHMDLTGAVHAEGKRKSSVAAVRVVRGSGLLLVNGRPLEAFFPDVPLRNHALHPLITANALGCYDAHVQVRGGGLSGKAQATGTALARALCVFNPGLRAQLADAVKWDGRMVERKKPARMKARRGYTWVKR